MSDYCVVQASIPETVNVEDRRLEIIEDIFDAISIKPLKGTANNGRISIEIVISELTLGESLEILEAIKEPLEITGPYFVVYGLI